MTVFGIDLGTTYSCLAYIDDTGRAAVAKNRLGEDTTPSVVYFESPDNIVVGRDAKNSAKLEPDHTVALIKREMGTDFPLSFHGQTQTPESISALILADLARSAGEFLGEPVQDVVITVPAYFGIAEREATRIAGRIAGLNVVGIVEEPVAAALHYEVMAPKGDRTILVYDLGGGTFDTSVIRCSGNDIEVVCVDGDHHLGGADWDERIVQYLMGRFLAEHPDSGADRDEQFVQELTIAAEEMKKSLSSTRNRRYNMRFEGGTTRAELSRETFEQITGDLFERTFDIVHRTMEVARKKNVRNIDEVLLVGGATRMPRIAAILAERFDFSPQLHEPDLAVAKGAARFALIESVRTVTSRTADVEDGATATPSAAIRKVADQLNISPADVMSLAAKRMVTVVPHAFGIKVVDEKDPARERLRVHHLLAANTPLPARPDPQTFVTVEKNQTAVEIEVMEQAGAVASPLLEDNRSIGRGVISGLPPLAADSPIEVTFTLDEAGVLRVHAVEPKTGKDLHMELRIQGMSDEQVDQARNALLRYQADG